MKTLRTTDNGQRTTGKNGFTLVEIIIAVLLLAIAIVPMVNAYAPAIFSTSGEEEMAVFTNQVRGTLNRTVALDFATLDDLVKNNQADPVDLAALFGSADETFSFKGRNYTPRVVIEDVSYDPEREQFIGGLLEMTVTIHHVSLKTLKAEY